MSWWRHATVAVHLFLQALEKIAAFQLDSSHRNLSTRSLIQDPKRAAAIPHLCLQRGWFIRIYASRFWNNANWVRVWISLWLHLSHCEDDSRKAEARPVATLDVNLNSGHMVLPEMDSGIRWHIRSSLTCFFYTSCMSTRIISGGCEECVPCILWNEGNG